MLVANRAVASALAGRSLAAVFRVHEPPSEERLNGLRELLLSFGLLESARSPLDLQGTAAALQRARGRPEESLVNQSALRAMRQARYDSENLGHYALGFTSYLHFTSPIRRYPALIVHRVLTDVLVHKTAPPYLAERLASVAERCSGREQAAAEAERASIALKKVEFMERHLGDSFPGRVSGVAAFGFFVTLDDFFVDGLVHVSGLEDDFYHFRENEHALVGERGGRRFRLGDRVEVQVARVDKEARHVDFRILGKLPGN